MLFRSTPPAEKKKGMKKEGPSTSQAQKPLLRSGVDLELLNKMDSLNGNLSGLRGELTYLKDMLYERLSALITCLETSLTAVLKRDDPPPALTYRASLSLSLNSFVITLH